MLRLASYGTCLLSVLTAGACAPSATEVALMPRAVAITEVASFRLEHGRDASAWWLAVTIPVRANLALLARLPDGRLTSVAKRGGMPAFGPVPDGTSWIRVSSPFAVGTAAFVLVLPARLSPTELGRIVDQWSADSMPYDSLVQRVAVLPGEVVRVDSGTRLWSHFHPALAWGE